jgi:hypothetical protein
VPPAESSSAPTRERKELLVHRVEEPAERGDDEDEPVLARQLAVPRCTCSVVARGKREVFHDLGLIRRDG